MFLLLAVFPLAVAAQTLASVSGSVVDLRGSAIEGARITLTMDGRPDLETKSDAHGQFVFSGVFPAAFHLIISASGFSSSTLAGNVAAAQSLALAPATLQIAPLSSNVDVTLTQNEIAQEEVAVEEKQRLLGVLPNYYVTYDPHPAPLSAKQKWDLAWKTSYDPVTIGIAALIAGVGEARHTYRAYGQGTEGYAKHFGAAYGDFFSGVMLGGVVLPVLLKQDPRYYYKGTGTKTARLLYAIERSFICQGDNGRPQFNYSAIIGGLASGAISNLYYPAQNRNGAGLTFKNAGLGIAGGAISNIVQEFFFRKLTRKPPHIGSASVD
jgi:hypothetical protein